MVSEKLKFKITDYFVTSVHISILNIVSTKLKDRDALNLQNIKRLGQSFFIF